MVDEEQRAAATIESLSIGCDPSEQLFGTPSVIGSQQSTDYGLWDKFGFTSLKGKRIYRLETIVSKMCSH